jgi:hypothetical protein
MDTSLLVGSVGQSKLLLAWSRRTKAKEEDDYSIRVQTCTSDRGENTLKSFKNRKGENHAKTLKKISRHHPSC